MKQQLFLELVKHLNQLVLVYRHLFDTVRKEKAMLLSADLQGLSDVNQAKELMLKKINEIEKKWMAVASEMQPVLGLSATTPRLLEIAESYTGAEREKLLRFRTVLNLIIQRTSALNKQNDQLAKSALSHIAGAMQAFTDTLNKKSNYLKKGKRSESSMETSGRLVSKEV
jgi:hypothetical protein